MLPKCTKCKNGFTLCLDGNARDVSQELEKRPPCKVAMYKYYITQSSDHYKVASSVVDKSLTISHDNVEPKNCVKLHQLREQALPLNNPGNMHQIISYKRDILQFLIQNEKKHRPISKYMMRQNYINSQTRAILVDWLVDIGEHFHFETETIFLTVSYIDRILRKVNNVMKYKLQRIGITAMYIAAKYEEIRIKQPTLDDIVNITNRTHSKAKIKRMERKILKFLKFDLCTTTLYAFVNIYANLTNIPTTVRSLTQYICELTLLEDEPYLQFIPSLIVAAAFALANYTLEQPIWSSKLEEITAYRLEDLKNIVLYLCKSHNRAITLRQQKIQAKYKADRYDRVSSIPPVVMSNKMFDEILEEYKLQQQIILAIGECINQESIASKLLSDNLEIEVMVNSE